MINSIRKFFAPTLAEALDGAIKQAAQLHGDLEEAQQRANYYTVAVSNTDPFKDHWTFAHVRQKQLDAQAECAVLERRRLSAAIKAEELINELTKDADAPATPATPAPGAIIDIRADASAFIRSIDAARAAAAAGGASSSPRSGGVSDTAS